MKRSSKVPGVVAILGVVAVANFVAFWVVAVLIGGDALSGKTQNGHHFLASHGRLTEVSAGVFTYSLWHTRSVIVTHLAWMVSWVAYAVRARVARESGPEA